MARVERTMSWEETQPWAIPGAVQADAASVAEMSPPLSPPMCPLGDKVGLVVHMLSHARVYGGSVGESGV